MQWAGNKKVYFQNIIARRMNIIKFINAIGISKNAKQAIQLLLWQFPDATIRMCNVYW